MESLYHTGMKILVIFSIALILVAPVDVSDSTMYPIPEEPITIVIEEIPPVDPEQHLCLQKNIYFEARNQGKEGMRGVAAVTMNRVKDPRWPDTVCGVVYQRKQFSWANRGDRNPSLRNPIEQKAWDKAGRIAERAILGVMEHQIGEAQYFHTTSINPGWRGVNPVVTIGDHVFLHQPM